MAVTFVGWETMSRGEGAAGSYIPGEPSCQCHFFPSQ